MPTEIFLVLNIYDGNPQKNMFIDDNQDVIEEAIDNN